MNAQILSGIALAKVRREQAREEIAKLGFSPRVVALHNAEHPACRVYMRMQKNLFEKTGVEFEVQPIETSEGEKDVRSRIEALNRDGRVHGITIHMPLPAGMDPDLLLRAIDPKKDIEGTHPHNIGMIAYGEHSPSPCAARAAVELAKVALPSFEGLEACVVGHGTLVGKSIAFLLLQSKMAAATPTVCHIATKDLAFHTRRADLLFVGVGKANLVRKDMVKAGATVIDIGTNKIGDRIVGDVAEEVGEIAGWLSPVPGGVGPVTLAVLLENVVACARQNLGTA